VHYADMSYVVCDLKQQSVSVVLVLRVRNGKRELNDIKFEFTRGQGVWPQQSDLFIWPVRYTESLFHRDCIAFWSLGRTLGLESPASAMAKVFTMKTFGIE